MNVKRYEWVSCDEHACHRDVVESAEGDMVDYEDYAALEARCAALAAENAGLKAEHELALQYMDELRANFTMYKKFKCNSESGVGTPATDAFLAEVRAQGVEMLARETEKLEWHESTVRFVLKFAAQIRKGAQS